MGGCIGETGELVVNSERDVAGGCAVCESGGGVVNVVNIVDKVSVHREPDHS